VRVSASPDGRPLGDIIAEIEERRRRSSCRPVRHPSGGDAEELKDMFSNMLQALFLAVVFIYLILASQFGSFTQPFSIMLSLPLSLVGVALALLITRDTLNIMSMIGLIMLMGLVTKNAILLVDFANQRDARAWPERGPHQGGSRASVRS
jgi:multidrug efflux pump subunit AcrB